MTRGEKLDKAKRRADEMAAKTGDAYAVYMKRNGEFCATRAWRVPSATPMLHLTESVASLNRRAGWE